MTRLLAVTMALAATLAMAGCDRPATDAGLPRGVALDPDNGGLILPDGFSAVVVFDGTGESREIFIRDDGDIFVSLSGLREGPHILGLRDEDGDWRIDRVERFFDVSTPKQQKVPRVHIAYRDGYLYAVTNEQLVRLIRSVLHGMQGPVEIDGVLYDEVMPAHDFLSDTKLAELLTYIRQEFGGGADPIHKSEVTLVRNVDARTEPWQAAELERTLGIPGSEGRAGQ